MLEAALARTENGEEVTLDEIYDIQSGAGNEGWENRLNWYGKSGVS